MSDARIACLRVEPDPCYRCHLSQRQVVVAQPFAEMLDDIQRDRDRRTGVGAVGGVA